MKILNTLFAALAIAVALCVWSGSASAQTTQPIVTQLCNVAQTDCAMTDEAGDAIEVSGARVVFGPVTVAINSQPAKSCNASGSVVSIALYKRVDDVLITCDDGTSLSATYIATRSGSGRGGWVWHYHVAFGSITFP